MSQCMPFMQAPALLDGTLAGDVGFDPLGFVQQKKDLYWYREAEIKHGRLAMLAAAGWPIAELWSGDFLHGDGGTNGRAPSLFNGHLLDYLPVLVIIFGPLAFLEFTARGKPDSERLGVGGDYGFDPMGLAGPQ